MQLLSENNWVKFFQNAGFNNVTSWRHGKKEDWEGTLIVTGTK
jgi:hypothetical protein